MDSNKNRAANARSKLKKTNVLASKPLINLSEDEKKIKSIQFIYDTIKKFFTDPNKKPITKTDLKKIVDLASKYKLALTSDAISALLKNRQNVSQFIAYFDERLIDFFNHFKLLPDRSNPLFKVSLFSLINGSASLLSSNNSITYELFSLS